MNNDCRRKFYEQNVREARQRGDFSKDAVGRTCASLIMRQPALQTRASFGKGMFFLRHVQVSGHSSANPFLCHSLNRAIQKHCPATHAERREPTHPGFCGSLPGKPAPDLAKECSFCGTFKIQAIPLLSIPLPFENRPTQPHPPLLPMRKHHAKTNRVPPRLRWHGLAGGGEQFVLGGGMPVATAYRAQSLLRGFIGLG